MSGSGGVQKFRIVTLTLPEVLVRRLEGLDADLEAAAAELLLWALRLDPSEEVEARVGLAWKYLEEGKRLVDSDPVQASEKLYKAAEEAVKALAVYHRLEDILGKVRERGRWTVSLLSKAVTRLAKLVGSWVLDAWDHAWALHVWGFHEAKLDAEDVKVRIPYVEKLVRYAEETCKGSGG